MARKGSIPGIDVNEQESIKPVLSSCASQTMGLASQASAVMKEKRSSLPSIEVPLGNPYGQSPFFEIEIGCGEVSLSS